MGSTTSGAYPDAPQIVVDLPTASMSGNYTVQVTVDGCDSEVSEPLAVFVNEIPTVNPSFAYILNTDCSPSDLSLFTNPALGSGSNATYQWSGPNGFASTDENPVIADVSEDYNGSYELIISDENGCSSNSTVEIEGITDVVAEPVITATPQTCKGGTLVLTIPAYQGSSVTYTWNIPGSTANITGQGSNQLTIFPADASHNGDYSITINVDGCELTSADYEVVIFETPTVVAANDGVECIAQMTDLNLTASPASGSGNYTYQWSGSSGFTSTAQNPIIPNAGSASAGTYTVVITDENGCTAEASTVVDVSTGPDEPVVISNGPVCEGEQLVISTDVYTGTLVSYEWVGPLGSTTSGAYPDAPQIIIDLPTALEGGIYTVSVTVDGCTSEVSEPLAVTVNEIPTVFTFLYLCIECRLLAKRPSPVCQCHTWYRDKCAVCLEWPKRLCFNRRKPFDRGRFRNI